MIYILVGLILFGITTLSITFYSFSSILQFEKKRPFVSTPRNARRKIAEYLELKSGDIVYDLGCGNGSLLRTLERKNKNAPLIFKGVELSLLPYLLARTTGLFTKSHVIILRSDYFKINLKDASVIYCYLSRGTMEKLFEKFEKECKPGTRIISYGFPIPNQTPERKEQLGKMFLYFYRLEQ